MKAQCHLITRSVSLDADLVLWLVDQAAGEGRSASSFVNHLLRQRRTAARRSASLVALHRRKAQAALPQGGTAAPAACQDTAIDTPDSLSIGGSAPSEPRS